MSMEEKVIIQEDIESPNNPLFHRRRCCFQLPCFGSSPSSTRHVTLGGPTTSSASTSSFWDRFRTGDTGSRWWARPFIKIREWSEIIAGPQWKTFIRRFNRRRHNHRHHHQTTAGKFQYDPLSYALNFDEGPGQNGHFDEEYNNGHFPDFSSRFAAVPLSSPKSPSEPLANVRQTG
ncbi:Auxilin-related protein 2 [Bienertia sinuspersici]